MAATKEKARPFGKTTEPKTEHKSLSAKEPEKSREKTLIFNDRLIAYIKKSVCHYPSGLSVAELGAVELFAQKQGCSENIIRETAGFVKGKNLHATYAKLRHPTETLFENDDGNEKLIAKMDKKEPFTIENARENGVLYYKGQLTMAATGFRFYAALVHNMLIAYNPETSCKGNFKDCPACSVIRAMFEEWGVM